jgi:hypothetical protein
MAKIIVNNIHFQGTIRGDAYTMERGWLSSSSEEMLPPTGRLISTTGSGRGRDVIARPLRDSVRDGPAIEVDPPRPCPQERGRWMGEAIGGGWEILPLY